MDKKPLPKRDYLGLHNPEALFKYQWAVQKEQDGRLAWHKKWGEPLLEIHRNWVNSDIRRQLRKPSYESLEWLLYQRTFEVPQAGEWTVRQQGGVSIGGPQPQCHSTDVCKPFRWPRTTYGEIGWLGQHKNCQLEKYDMKYMRKPPLPWYMTKISDFPVN